MERASSREDPRTSPPCGVNPTISNRPSRYSRRTGRLPIGRRVPNGRFLADIGRAVPNRGPPGLPPQGSVAGDQVAAPSPLRSTTFDILPGRRVGTRASRPCCTKFVPSSELADQFVSRCLGPDIGSLRPRRNSRPADLIVIERAPVAITWGARTAGVPKLADQFRWPVESTRIDSSVTVDVRGCDIVHAMRDPMGTVLLLKFCDERDFPPDTRQRCALKMSARPFPRQSMNGVSR